MVMTKAIDDMANHNDDFSFKVKKLLKRPNPKKYFEQKIIKKSCF